LPPPNQEAEPQPEVKSRFVVFYSRLFSVVKLLLGICLLPFVYSATVVFLQEAQRLEAGIVQSLATGVAVLLIFYLFIWEPGVVYAKGQKILQAIFKFFAPLVKVAPYLLPIYTIILFLLCGLVGLISRSTASLKYFVFLFGFSITLHLVFGAKSLRSRKGDFLKANYIFGFSFVYILNIALLSFGLSLFFEKFSFVNFCNLTYLIGQRLYVGLFRQFFL